MRYCHQCTRHRMADCGALCRADQPEPRHRRYCDCTEREPKAEADEQ